MIKILLHHAHESLRVICRKR